HRALYVAGTGAVVDRSLYQRHDILAAAIGDEANPAAHPPIVVDYLAQKRIGEDGIDAAFLRDCQCLKDFVPVVVSLDQFGHIDEIACVCPAAHKIAAEDHPAEDQVPDFTGGQFTLQLADV